MSRYDELAEQLDRIADHYRLDGDTKRAAVYGQAAETVRTTWFIPADPALIDGIGDSLREDIEQWRVRGSIDRLERLDERRPWLKELCTVSGIGPKTAAALAEEGIESKEELETAVETGAVLEVSGIGKKTSEKLNETLKSNAD